MEAYASHFARVMGTPGAALPPRRRCSIIEPAMRSFVFGLKLLIGKDAMGQYL